MSSQTLLKIQEIFQAQFNDKDISLNLDMSRKDFKEWDSVGHVELMLAIEEEFEIQFSTSEIIEMADPSIHLSNFISIIEKKRLPT